MLVRCGELKGQLSRTKQMLNLLDTPVLFLRRQANMSAPTKTYCVTHMLCCATYK